MLEIQENTEYYFSGLRGLKDEIGIPNLSKINLIIGPNNAGKSTILDALAFFTASRRDSHLPLWDDYPWQHESRGTLTFGFYKKTNDPKLQGLMNLLKQTEKIVGEKIKIEAINSHEYQVRDIITTNHNDHALKHTLSRIEHPLKDKLWLRIRADRDIAPESMDKSKMILSENGRGASAAINFLIRNPEFSDSPKIIDQVLSGLNEIYRGIAEYTDIEIKDLKDGQHRIVLREKGRDFLIPISEMGSGIKTILLILINLYVYPYILKTDLDRIILTIEEPENNLHPYLEKNLYAFLKKVTTNLSNFRIIFTTHSNVALNFFNGTADTSIWKISREKDTVSLDQVENRYSNYEILDLLGILPADILQANGLIWVEGPSDRIFINKFIELYSNGTIREGVHYQCVFYGGSLLANLSIEETMESNEVNLLNVNRNIAIIMDSDKKERLDALKSRVEKIISAAKKSEQTVYTWITEGKEIENYLPKESIEHAYKTKIKREISQLEDFVEFLNEQSENKNLGNRYDSAKKDESQKISKHITQDNLSALKNDLPDRLVELITAIKRWNLMTD